MEHATIIVGWDGSGPSRRALEWAMQRPAATGAQIVLVSVVDDGAFEHPFRDDEQIAAAAESVELAAANAQAATSSYEVRAVLRRGDRLDVLRGLSGPEVLLVVGTRARHRARLRYDWSVGARLAATAHGPVAIVPDTVPRGPGSVVAGVDDTEACWPAVVFAAEEAGLRRASLHLIHAWREPTVWQELSAPSDEFVDELSRTHEHIVRDMADRVREDFPELHVVAEAVHEGPARAILSATPAPELIVVGSRERSGHGRLLLGSVGHDLLLNLDVPVVVVRPTPSAASRVDDVRETPKPTTTEE